MLQKIFISIFFLLFVSGCSKNPDESGLEKALQEKLINPWVIESLDIVAEEDTGSETEPARKYRLVVEISPSEALYKRVGSLMNVSIVKLLRNIGEEKEFHVIATSVYKNGAWNFSFKPEANPYKGEGTVGSHGAKKYVINNSPEHGELIEKANRRIIKERIQIKTLEEEISTIDNKYKSEFLNYDEVKKEFDIELNTAIVAKNKSIKALHTQVRQDIQKKTKKSKAIRIKEQKLAAQEFNKIKSKNTAKYKIEDKKILTKLKTENNVRINDDKKAKSQYSNQLKKAKKSMNKTQYKEFQIKARDELASKKHTSNEIFKKVSVVLQRERKQLRVELQESNKGPHSEYTSISSKIVANSRLELKQYQKKRFNEEKEKRKEIEKPYVTLHNELEKKLQPFQSKLKSLEQQRSRLKQTRNNLMSNVKNIKVSLGD